MPIRTNAIRPPLGPSLWLVVCFTGCNSPDTTTGPETDFETSVPESGDPFVVDSDSAISDSDVSTDSPVDSEDPMDTAVPAVAIPFGFWGLNGYVSEVGLTDVASRFHITVFQTASTAPHYTATSLLPLVREQGFQVTLRLTGWHEDYSTDGNFDLQKWKLQLQGWETACDANNADCIQPFIDDGTLIGHMLLDDIFTFPGNAPTAAELDEMARYSEELFPGLMTFVRNKASTMPEPEGGTYQHLDACVNQYTNYQGYPDGPIEAYALEQAASAEALGLEVINGLNIADGGNGSSGIEGWSAGKYAMSAEEITTYGTPLLDRETFPHLRMFLMWEYDGEELWSDGTSVGADIFDQPEWVDAFEGLAGLAEPP